MALGAAQRNPSVPPFNPNYTVLRVRHKVLGLFACSPVAVRTVQLYSIGRLLRLEDARCYERC